MRNEGVRQDGNILVQYKENQNVSSIMHIRLIGWSGTETKTWSSTSLRFRKAVNNAAGMALCRVCLPEVQEVPGSIHNWDTWVSDTLCRGFRWSWSSPYIVVTPIRCISLAPLHAIEVRAPCSLSRYLDLHESDQINPCPSQTQPQFPVKSLRHSGLGGGGGL